MSSKFISNNATTKAACIYSLKSVLDVKSSEFEGNQANQGGCIHTKEG